MFIKEFLRFSYVIYFLVILLIIKFFLERFSKNKRCRPNILIGNAQGLGDRKEQEDSFATIKNENGLLAVLADGMGGLELGQQASNIVVRTFLEEFSRTYSIESINKFLINTTYISNEKVLQLSADRKLGTTIVAVLIDNNYLHWIAVGDSNIYLYRDKELILLNQPHIYANYLRKEYKNGDIGRDELLNHPKRNMLTSYLGYEDFHEIDYSTNPIKLRKKDKIILCSDGISNNLSEMELENLLDNNLDPGEIAEVILERAMERHIGSRDNSTIIILDKFRK